MTIIEGRFAHLVYGPHGNVEGVLLARDEGPAQIVFAKHDEVSPIVFEPVTKDQTIAVEADLQGPSPKGRGAHPVFAFRALLSIDGEEPAKPRGSSGAAYRGVVVRLNYARHGAANGVVLDSGDFIHTKPEGMAKLRLKVGDPVEADGDAQLLATGDGWAVEATRVNRKTIGSR